MPGCWCWPTPPVLQVATSKPHASAIEDGPQGWQLSSPLQHREKETTPAGTGKLLPATAHRQVVPNNHLCFRLCESRSGVKEQQDKLLISRNTPWGQDTNLQLTIT